MLLQKESLPIGSQVQYCCNAGFHQRDGISDVIECTATGEWSSTVPKCTGKMLWTIYIRETNIVHYNSHLSS